MHLCYYVFVRELRHSPFFIFITCALFLFHQICADLTLRQGNSKVTPGPSKEYSPYDEADRDGDADVAIVDEAEEEVDDADDEAEETDDDFDEANEDVNDDDEFEEDEALAAG